MNHRAAAASDNQVDESLLTRQSHHRIATGYRYEARALLGQPCVRQPLRHDARQDRVAAELATPCRADLKGKKIMVMIGEVQSNGVIAAHQQQHQRRTGLARKGQLSLDVPVFLAPNRVIASRVGIPAERGDPLGQMKISTRALAQGVKKDATALLTACGLALRSFD
jgi:hypothetical protein